MGNQTVDVVYQKNVLYTNSFALVVGIDKYDHDKIPTLKFAECDAEAVANRLLALGFPKDNIKLLLGKMNKVTRESIMDILEKEFNPNMEEGNRFLFYFAGHGVSYEANKQTRGYILMQDSQLYGRWPNRSKPHFKKIPAKALEMGQFLDFVTALPAKHKLLLIDSCFSGFMTNVRGLPAGPSIDIKKRLNLWLREPVTQVITAGKSGQKAYEKEAYQHGVFTYYLLKGLEGNADPRGDGIISFMDLAAYICNRVSQEILVEQNPQIGTYKGEGQFFFI
ncbi:MAG: caspase family protein, partial [Acidobacteria bacterium]|nr:caspase family protein [Acidobacteriota bacterium]